MSRHSTPAIQVARLTSLSESEVVQLADVLVDCVAGGASVGFMHPLALDAAAAFWRGQAGDIETGKRAVFVARREHRVVGTVQLVPAAFENQPHRADIAKMLVHRDARRCGVGAALLRAAEAYAVQLGRWLLVLDTVTDSDAERLYRKLGWQSAGIVPDYALMPDGALTSTHFFYRNLGESG